MNYIHQAANGSLNTLFRDFDVLANRVFGEMDRPSGFPRVDVFEREGEYILEAEIPGYSEKDVEVRVKDSLLTISGQPVKPAESGQEGAPRYLIRERRDTGFERSFKLPKDADPGQVTALYRNGILTLTIARKPEAQPRQITIRTE